MTKQVKRRSYGTKYLLMVILVFIQMLVFVSTTQAGTFTEVSGFGSNPGQLKMYKYIPDNIPANAPLVVSLHGCTQTARSYSSNGWTDLADKLKFYLLFPEQQISNNVILCFNWFEPGDQKRGSGEAQSIISMVEKMKSDHSIDNSKIYIEGLSAGGYMTSIMLAAYPDVFVAGGVNAGGPAYCALNQSSASSCMSPGKDKSPAAWGDLIKSEGYREHTGPWPRVSIWHGTNDTKVKIKNQQELMEQWCAVHGIDTVPDKEDTIHGHDHKEYHDLQGNVLVETYSIKGMGHATPVDPGFSEANGCGKAGAYIEDRDICGVYYMARFWKLDGGGGQLCPDGNHPPKITLKGKSKVKLNLGDSFTDEGASAVDTEDGDISSNIRVTGSVNTGKKGTYLLKYNVSDSKGCKAAEESRTVIVGVVCKEWTELNSTHESEGRAYSSWSWQWFWPFIVVNYYTKGSDELLGRGSDRTTIRTEKLEQNFYRKGGCPDF